MTPTPQSIAQELRKEALLYAQRKGFKSALAAQSVQFHPLPALDQPTLGKTAAS